MIAHPFITALAILALPGAATVFAQGALTPPGAPAPMMKTLDQIEARTPIGTPGQVTTTTIVISSPGSYVLMGPVTVASGTAIQINASGVTLDLNGFAITSTNPGMSGSGILVASGLSGITLRNGHIRGSMTISGDAYVGGGFENGILATGTENVLVEGISVQNIPGFGIYAENDPSAPSKSTVRNCQVAFTGGTGIQAVLIECCSAVPCGMDAIKATSARNSTGYCTGSGAGINTFEAINCTGMGTDGYGIAATTHAINCTAVSETGTALYAGSAFSCNGTSRGGGYGILSNAITHACMACSESGIALSATNAIGCVGTTQTGTCAISAIKATSCHAYANGTGCGLSTYAAENCRAQNTAASGASPALIAQLSATDCTAESVSNSGIETSAANGCHAKTTSGTRALYCTNSASNSFGYANGSGTGLVAGSAINCHGASISGYGVIINNCATNCTGSSASGVGLYATTASNCAGYSETGAYGLSVGGSASNCRGRRPGGVAINATIAVSCTSADGTITATNKYNMPATP